MSASVSRRLLVTFILALTAASALMPAAADPRPPEAMDAAAIRLALQKINVVGSALYVGAHPDDENTAVLAWLSKGRLVRTGYLSLTRGDGGQNLIGTEIGAPLGVIRTQELLGARRVDGAEQFFSRAVDFGYSKDPDETLAIWGRERILADVVWVIRRFRPDVILTRFPTDGSGGHGHHTASAILAEEAFRAAGDSTRFPEQLRRVRPWQAKRIVWNVFRFGGAGPDTVPGRIQVDVGAYNALLGRSYTEIAGEARTMHKSQGFGSAERRGAWSNSFEHRGGERAERDLFDGVNLGWSRIAGGAKLTPLFEQALREFRPERPQAILPLLLRAHAILAALPAEPMVERKRTELLELIRSCAGLWLEAVAAAPSASPGSPLRVVTAAILRSDAALRLERVELIGDDRPALAQRDGARALAFNTAATDTFQVSLPRELATTPPYWLRARPLAGSFEVADQRLIGDAENAPALVARFVLAAAGESLVCEAPVVYRWTDPVEGERYRAFDVVPPVTLRFDHGAYLFPDVRSREIRVTVRSADVPVSGTLRLALPEGWQAVPPAAPVVLPAGEADTTVRFTVTPAGGPAVGAAGAVFEMGGERHGAGLVQIAHRHIPVQIMLPPAEAKLVRVELAAAGREIGYVTGAGDEVPEALRQMGFHVTLLGDEDIEEGDLSRYDAIVVGVRAYNTRPRLLGHQRRLLDYVAAGGRLVVQYNTAENALQDRLGPYPFRISRDRVTVEEALVRFLAPGHPLLTAPNRIGAEDFAGWVQERGLYFANPRDAKYETVISCNDPGEPARDGGLLYARHGRGVFIYTGYAFFRQLPAGVPGAWRLFANLVSAAR
ncbi:MAG: PIG-L family deacetylase [Candidatus Eisenbacteria bacterium]|nr:PIG-L family deacetylase [Candidatus Eisenbacteria bacterium]